MFDIGQKIVCVFANVRSDSLCKVQSPLRQGHVYTVLYSDKRMTLLEEVDAPEPHVGFLTSRFRPVVERKTDISIFTQLLTPTTPRKELV